jgi:glycosyltransferase involved in cell wall biosynthesis
VSANINKASATPTIRASILIPARNEQQNIAACVNSLLLQGEEFEIIVADDSSEDRTAEIVTEIAAQHPQVSLLRVPPLPPAWLGKNYALHSAAKIARAEWLLFTDADTRHEPGKLPAVITRAERDGIALLSFSPEQITETWWERAVIPIIYNLLAQLYDFKRANDPADKQAAANGQYILIRRTIHDAIGGHAGICGEVLEDVLLARRVKHSGQRIWFGSGKGIVRTRMYRRFGDMWEGWTKNLYLLFDRNPATMRRAAARLITHPCLNRHYLTGAPIVLLLLLNSYWRYSRNLGVSWKGRRYSSGG